MDDYNIECKPIRCENFWLPNEPLIGYLAYPYAKPNPRKNMERAREIATKIMRKHPNIFVIVPHTAVDMTLFGSVPEKVETHSVEEHLFAAQLEYTILWKIDLLILGMELDFDKSQGMCWETGFARWRQTQGGNVKIVHAEELL